MSVYQTAYVPIGVPTFHLDSAQAEFEKSLSLLSALSKSVKAPDKMLLTMEDLGNYLDGLDPDLIILQNLTFANSAYTAEVLRRFDCPLLLWTLREPVIDGGRLRLNSLTGAYSAANTLHAFGREDFLYVFGSPEEAEVAAVLRAAIRAGEVRRRLKDSKLAAIGHTPAGFGFGRALDSELTRVFGPVLESLEARELIDRARAYTDEECLPYLDEAGRAMTGLKNTPERNLKDFARLCKAYSDYVNENGINALASRCWPDFFTSYGTPVCAVLSMLNDGVVPSACESDVYGALSMYIGALLSGRPAFFGDPVSLNETEGTVTFWHCGMAPCSMAREDSGAAVGLHPNRRLGPVMDFGCAPCEDVTVFRIGRTPGGRFRIFAAEGAALDRPKQFEGTSVVVKTRSPSGDLVRRSVEDGWEPHFAVVYGAIRTELEYLGKMLGVEVCVY